MYLIHTRVAACCKCLTWSKENFSQASLTWNNLPFLKLLDVACLWKFKISSQNIAVMLLFPCPCTKEFSTFTMPLFDFLTALLSVWEKATRGQAIRWPLQWLHFLTIESQSKRLTDNWFRGRGKPGIQTW